MKKLLLLWALLSVACLGTAQFTPCLYDLGLENLEKQFPGYQERSQATIKKAVQQYRQQRSPNDEVLLIPVVVHVVWKEAAENISDERIAAQIRVLNESYRR